MLLVSLMLSPHFILAKSFVGLATCRFGRHFCRNSNHVYLVLACFIGVGEVTNQGMRKFFARIILTGELFSNQIFNPTNGQDFLAVPPATDCRPFSIATATDVCHMCLNFQINTNSLLINQLQNLILEYKHHVSLHKSIANHEAALPLQQRFI